MNQPARVLSILIYGNEESAAVAAVAGPEVRKTLEGVGHKVSLCSDASNCEAAVGSGRFDVVLADAKDAPTVRKSPGTRVAVVPLFLRAPKEELSHAKAVFGQAFDAAGGGLRLLPVVNRAGKGVTR